jgi:hypothetical protein
VANHHELVERGIEPVGVDLLADALEALPQVAGGERDGVVRVVGEEPELDPLAELGIVLELVDDVRPAAGLDAVPWTSTTGARPGRCGWSISSPSGNEDVRADRKAPSSVSQTGAPSSW